jgi:hypothetical protein
MRSFGNMRAATPWVVLAISAVMAVAAVSLGVSGDADEVVIVVSIAVLGLVFGVTGALVASRSPGNPIGWIFCAMALLFESSILGDAYVIYGSGGLRPGSVWVGWMNQWLNNALAPTFIIFCFLLFPTGRLPSARWRAVVWTVALVAALHAASAALAPGALEDSGLENPAGIESAPFLGTVADVSIIVLVAPLMLLSALSLFVRLRRSSGVERQQMKWFAYAAALLAAYLVAGNAAELLIGGTFEGEGADLVFFLIFAAALSGVPVAMGVAILKHRLYDIDLLINKTLVYGALTGTLVFVYLGGVVGIQYVVRVLTGSESQLAVVASTLAIAALFNPLRRRIQHFIDRRFYRRKYDAAKTLEAFSMRLRNETNLETLSDDLAGVAKETVHPAHVSLWLRGMERGRSGHDE